MYLYYPDFKPTQQDGGRAAIPFLRFASLFFLRQFFEVDVLKRILERKTSKVLETLDVWNMVIIKQRKMK
jgi:hypothetical protein